MYINLLTGYYLVEQAFFSFGRVAMCPWMPVKELTLMSGSVVRGGIRVACAPRLSVACAPAFAVAYAPRVVGSEEGSQA